MMNKPTGRSVLRAGSPARSTRPGAMATDKRPSAQAEKSRTRREQILDAAFNTFARRGYRDTAIDDIAAAADTSKGGVYFHFPTKEAIFRELMRTTADRLAAKVERAVAAETDPIARAGRRAPHRARRPSPATGRWRGSSSWTRSAPGGSSTPRRTRSTTDSPRLIAGYLDEAVARRLDPADRHRGHRRRLVRRPQRGRRALAPGRRPGPARGRLPDAARAPPAQRRRARGADRRRRPPAGSRRDDRRRPAGRRRGGADLARRSTRSPPRPSACASATVRSTTRSDRALRGRRARPTSRRRSGCSRPTGSAIVGHRARLGGRAGRAGPVRRRREAAWRGASSPGRPGELGDGGPAGLPRGAGPVLLGGLGFTGRRAAAADDPWAPFGAASLVLPALAFARTRRRRVRSPRPRGRGRRSGRPARLRPRAGTASSPVPRELAPAPGALVARPAGAPLAIVGEQPGPRRLGPARRPLRRRRRPRPARQGRPGPPGRPSARRWSSTRSNALRRLAAAGPESTTFAFVRGGDHVPGRDAGAPRPHRGPRVPDGRDRRLGAARRGRRRRTPGSPPALLASDKDREEHAVVVDDAARRASADRGAARGRRGRPAILAAARTSSTW